MAKKKIEPSKRGATSMHVAFGKRLRAARLAANISQSDLGKELGISFQQVQKYEKGANRMDPMRMMQAAKIIGVSMDDLLGVDLSKGGNGNSEFTTVLATHEGASIVRALIPLSVSQRSFILDMTRRIGAVAPAE